MSQLHPMVSQKFLLREKLSLVENYQRAIYARSGVRLQCHKLSLVWNYSRWTISPWNLPSAGGATTGIPYNSSTVKNACLKIAVVTLRAPFTRNLFAIAKFLVVFVLQFSFFIQFSAFSIYFLCSVRCCTLTVYVCCHSFVLNFLVENSQMSTT